MFLFYHFVFYTDLFFSLAGFSPDVTSLPLFLSRLLGLLHPPLLMFERFPTCEVSLPNSSYSFFPFLSLSPPHLPPCFILLSVVHLEFTKPDCFLSFWIARFFSQPVLLSVLLFSVGLFPHLKCCPISGWGPRTILRRSFPPFPLPPGFESQSFFFLCWNLLSSPHLFFTITLGNRFPFFGPTFLYVLQLTVLVPFPLFLFSFFSLWPWLLLIQAFCTFLSYLFPFFPSD